MKEGLENIDKIVKQAFDGFEANVDPSVWGNIQSSIASSAGSVPAATSVVGKSLAIKIVAGVLAVSSIATGAYFIVNDAENKENTIAEANIEEPNVFVEDSEEENKSIESIEEAKTIKSITENEQQKVVEKVTEENVVEENKEEINSSENTDLNEESPVIVNSSKQEVDKIRQEEASSKEVTKAEESAAKKSKKSIDKKVETKKPSKEQQVFRGTIRANVTKGLAPLDVMFDVEGENIVSYLWDFGDNTTTTNEEAPFHTFYEPGKYKVELTIIDKNANPKTLIKIIDVESSTKSSLGFIQNSFSPNGDGTNDVYKLEAAKNIKTFNARVMDGKTGKVIFEWNNVEEGWDGKDISGRLMEPGTYALEIYAEGTDGKSHQKRQMITLYLR